MVIKSSLTLVNLRTIGAKSSVQSIFDFLQSRSLAPCFVIIFELWRHLVLFSNPSCFSDLHRFWFILMYLNSNLFSTNMVIHALVPEIHSLFFGDMWIYILLGFRFSAMLWSITDWFNSTNYLWYISLHTFLST